MNVVRPPNPISRSRCPVTCALDILGDKWTLIVVRDMFLGKRTYSELQNGTEKIPTNILADRLKRLEAGGIIRKEPYQQRPVRYGYHLTQKGKDLGPVLQELIKWGCKHLSNVAIVDPSVLNTNTRST
ncbi:MAG: helix-turn-helix domain-containing protein [Pseudomonadales bacterium]